VTFSVYFNRKAWKQWLAEIEGKIKKKIIK